MADNVTLPGTGAAVASDDIGGVQHQRAKVGWGVDGSYVDASATNPLPVTALPGTPAADEYLPVRLTDGSDFLADTPADRTTDNVGVALCTDAIANDTTMLTPKFAAVSASSSGDNTIVAAVTGKKIRVLSWYASANGTLNITFKSATAGNVTGPVHMTQFKSDGQGFSPVGHFETAAGEALVLNLSAAVAVGGSVAYVEV